MEDLKPTAYLVRFSTINNLDVFVKRNLKDLVIDTLITLKKDYEINIYGYVIMTDHICLILTPRNQQELDSFCEKFKKKVSTRVMELLEGDGFTEKRWLLFLVNFINKDNSESGSTKIWNLDYVTKPLHTVEEIETELTSLHHKPVEEGLVSNPEDYNFSSLKENQVETFALNREVI